MDGFIDKLEAELKKNANPEVAESQKAYMKNRFEFYGIKTPVRRKIQKPFLTLKNLPFNLKDILLANNHAVF